MLDFLENILIGIISGSISSVIVSIVFFIITNEQEDKRIAKKMIYPLHEILALTEVFKQYNDTYKDEYIQNAFKSLGENFSAFEPWTFSAELKGILNQVNDFASTRYGYTPILIEDLPHIHDETVRLISLFDSYERKFGNSCFKRIIKNRILWLLITITTILTVVLLCA